LTKIVPKVEMVLKTTIQTMFVLVEMLIVKKKTIIKKIVRSH